MLIRCPFLNGIKCTSLWCAKSIRNGNMYGKSNAVIVDNTRKIEPKKNKNLCGLRYRTIFKLLFNACLDIFFGEFWSVAGFLKLISIFMQ
jgi:hypothetical protein